MAQDINNKNIIKAEIKTKDETLILNKEKMCFNEKFEQANKKFLGENSKDCVRLSLPSITEGYKKFSTVLVTILELE